MLLNNSKSLSLILHLFLLPVRTFLPFLTSWPEAPVSGMIDRPVLRLHRIIPSSLSRCQGDRWVFSAEALCLCHLSDWRERKAGWDTTLPVKYGGGKEKGVQRAFAYVYNSDSVSWSFNPLLNTSLISQAGAWADTSWESRPVPVTACLWLSHNNPPFCHAGCLCSVAAGSMKCMRHWFKTN